MIAVRLMGGLGNQMFQYATALSVASKRKTGVSLDMSWFGNQAEGDTQRRFELNDFNIRYSKLSLIYKVAFARQDILGRVSRKLLNRASVYTEAGFAFNKSVLEQPDNTLFIGYFQCEKYFQSIREQLLKDFTLKSPLVGKNKRIAEMISASGASVSLHVRRGDYVSNKNAAKFHGTKSLSYYKKALEIVKRSLNETPTLFVFSDDPEWCKKNLKFNEPMVFVDHNKKGIEDLRLMSLCQHNIIANSSFSWWAAWLNNSPEKIVVAPRVWFKEKNIDTSDVIPEGWVKI